LRSFAKKSVGLVLFVLGLTASAFSLLTITILATEPAVPLAVSLVVTVVTCGTSFSTTYAGWRLWKDRKKPEQPMPAAEDTVPEPSSKPTGKANASVGSASAAGAASTAPAIMECPGCGAPVKVASSDPIQCEYCGNQIHVVG